MTVVETIDLRKVFGDTVAVERLTLSVGPGEIFGFLGPNGAGKTTTVKMLLGLVRPTAGQALVLGHAPGEPEAMRWVGFLPEHFRFHEWLTAGEFLNLHGRLYGMTAAQRWDRVPDLLAKVGLADWAGTRLAHFSKGMLQRIGLAQALLNNPRIVFLDEPTSGLDPLGRREVRDVIRELRDDGVAVFLNSHLLGEVEAVCDRVGIIRRGRVVRVGSVDELVGGAFEVLVRAEGLTPELVAGLSRWGRVVDQDGAHLRLAVETEDVLPGVSDWLVQGGARLYSLTPGRLTLEELFVRVMEEA